MSVELDAGGNWRLLVSVLPALLWRYAKQAAEDGMKMLRKRPRAPEAGCDYHPSQILPGWYERVIVCPEGHVQYIFMEAPCDNPIYHQSRNIEGINDLRRLQGFQVWFIGHDPNSRLG